MIIEPKIRGFVGLSAHPEGCRVNVQRQIDHVVDSGRITGGPMKVLVIGASTGYGLASRIAAAFGSGADTIGVFLERRGSATKSASAGWYNSAAFELAATRAGRGAWGLNGDAFTTELKEQTAKLVSEKLGVVDMVVYSLAAPRRTDPDTGEVYRSAIKPIGKPFSGSTVDMKSGDLVDSVIEPATDEEIRHTVGVMGGADWKLWINHLAAEGLLAPGCTTIAYSYVGPQVTWPIYRDGTIGQAKSDLAETADQLHSRMSANKGGAYICMNKALVTQASMAIPVLSLYVALLYEVMKNNGTHEGCIEQMDRLFRDRLLGPEGVVADHRRQIRLDDLEMAVQTKMESLWDQVTHENYRDLADIPGVQSDFLQMFGFDVAGVDYSQDVNPDVSIPSIFATG